MALQIVARLGVPLPRDCKCKRRSQPKPPFRSARRAAPSVQTVCLATPNSSTLIPHRLRFGKLGRLLENEGTIITLQRLYPVAERKTAELQADADI